MDLIAYIRDWQTLIGGLLTILAAFIGGRYVVLSTNRQIAAVADQFRETVRPFVIAKLGTYAGTIFCLEIQNIGQSAAADLSLELDRDFYQFGDNGKNLRDLEAFVRVVPQFAPGEKLTFLLSQGFNLDNVKDGIDLTPKTLKITTRYRFREIRYEEAYVIDMQHYFGVLALKNKHDILSEIAGYLKKISERK